MNEQALESIAVIGIAGRFPGAENVDDFWDNLRNGVESITFFSEKELESLGVPSEVIYNSNYVKARPVLNNIDLFDAEFFSFSPREAELTDPQQRIFLECAWSAMEDAGYTPGKHRGSVGVYAGATGIDTYFLNNLYANRELRNSVGNYQIAIANDKDFLATRVAYKLNLTGSAVTVQTACSTSLVAICMASQSLLNHESDMALAGGVSITVPQRTGYMYQEGMIFSPDGHCRAFDAKAKGTVVGSGVGVVVLKRLEDAIADKDYIHAVIKGFAVNNDGADKVGYTAPSVRGQARAISQALSFGEIHPETVTYVEAHGTGTPIGDPIEIAALTKAFRTKTKRKGYCAISSVKTNVGHLDVAAGVTGLIKAVQSLKHKMLPPSLHFELPNPEIDFVNSPFYVNVELVDWDTDRSPRRAGVSSFGIGGTNAHVVLEEAPELSSEIKQAYIERSAQARVWQRQRYWIDSPGESQSIDLYSRPNIGVVYVAPRDEIEEVVALVWEQFLGLKRVGVHDDFFALGGDSLSAVDLVAKLEKIFRVSMLPDALLEAPTIAELSALIRTTPSSFNKEEFNEKELVSPEQRFLVEIQSGKPKQPFFLVHPVGGHVYFYRDLARGLELERPVYGIQAQEAEEFETIEQMAVRYLEAVRDRQPDPPYFLGGSSFGGLVAFEMARQLKALGQDVALLALIDTPAPGQMPVQIEEDETATLLYLIGVGLGLSVEIESLRRLNPEEQLLYFLEQAKISSRVIPPDFGLTEVRQYLYLFKKHAKVMRKYTPQRYLGKIVFFRANERDAVNPQNPEAPWRYIATEGVEVVQVPGNHITMHYPPHVQILAERLRVHLV